MQIPWFIALQFLREYRGQAWLTMSAVSVGVAVMVFLSALITGLQTSLIEQTLGTQPHIKIQPAEEAPTPQRNEKGIVRRTQQASQRVQSISGWQKLVRRFEDDREITAVSPLATGNGFAVRGNVSRPIVIMGAVPDRFDAIIPVSENLQAGRFVLNGNEVAIGIGLAARLGLSVGDRIRLSTPEGRDALLTVQGLFDLGNQVVNERWALVPLRTGQALLGIPGSVNLIHLQTRQLFEAESVATRLSGSTGLEAKSWMEENEQLLVALKSQSSSSYTIQFFVFLAVAMGISSVLVVSVVQRTREIGILRAMGMTRAAVFGVFVLQGGLIGLFGSLMGCGLGAGLTQLFSRVAKGPNGAPTFPMALSWELFVFAACAATVTGMLAAALPARRAARLDPVEAIRHG